jgi:hypothetical protein
VQAMRNVVDSNYLGSQELHDYLSACRENKAVVTDYAELEMLNTKSLETFLKSTEILAQYPRQVILSQPIDASAGLRGKRKGLKKRLTDGKRTRDFRKWCHDREKIKRGEKPFDQAWLTAKKEALAHLGDIDENLATFKNNLITHAEEHYTPEELRIIRTHQPWTPELIGKVLDSVMHFARKLLEADSSRRKLPPIEDLVYSFVFRYALCAYLHALHWIAAGGAKDRKPEKFRNDLIDVTLAAYATCFDGFLTRDNLASEIYDNAMFLLKSGFLRKDLLQRDASLTNS